MKYPPRSRTQPQFAEHRQFLARFRGLADESGFETRNASSPAGDGRLEVKLHRPDPRALVASQVQWRFSARSVTGRACFQVGDLATYPTRVPISQRGRRQRALLLGFDFTAPPFLPSKSLSREVGRARDT
jgi:hypothetical protein